MTISEAKVTVWRGPATALAALCLLFGAVDAGAQTAAQRLALERMKPAAVRDWSNARPRAAQTAEAADSLLSRPNGVAYDSYGNVYIADAGDNTVREVTPLGTISTVAGNGEQGFGGDGGAATSAILDTPAGVAVDAAGNLYIADSHNHRIRRVMAGTIATLAGTGVAGFSGDGGAASGATLDLPTALAVDASGALYVADTNNHRVRKISNSLIVTVAGDGEQMFSGDGAAATQAGLDSPIGVAVDAAGNLYIGDTHNQRVRMVAAGTGLISTVAGSGAKAFSGDGGPGVAAALVNPRGVAIAPGGVLYIADSDNQRVRSVNSGGTISTVAGDGEQGFAGDTGPAASAIFNTPRAVAVNSASTVAIADTGNDRVRELLAAGSETVAGTGAPGTVALLISAPTSVVAGNGVLTSVLSNASASARGTVTFLDVTNAVTTLGTAPLTDGTGTVSLAGVSPGTHLFAARFQGDANLPVLTSGVVGVDVLSNDFTISAAPSAEMIVAGGSANFTVTLLATGDSFGNPVALTASGLPDGATASFAPATIEAGQPKTATSVLTVQTAALSARGGVPFGLSNLPLAAGLLCLPLCMRRRFRMMMQDKPTLSCLLLFAAVSLSGCGSGVNPNAHPPKTYTIVVTGTSAAVGPIAAVTHSATVTLTLE